jgi:Protein adenylyltransferase SoFic-like, C-terminal domain
MTEGVVWLLPPDAQLETRAVLKALAPTHRYLAELKGLDIPELYLSRYNIHNKADYHLLQSTLDTGEWEPWILYMLEGIALTARQTIWIIRRIKVIMMACKHHIRAALPKMYSQDLLNNLFRHPYTKIESVQNDLRVSRLTAAKYLERLTPILYGNSGNVVIGRIPSNSRCLRVDFFVCGIETRPTGVRVGRAKVAAHLEDNFISHS